MLRANKPDLLHAHYASGYGTLSRLSGFSPNILSVWGSDVYEFPYQSKRKESLLRKNLRAADFLWTTSRALEQQTMRFVGTEREIEITPFGIDCDHFTPGLARPADDTFVVGTVKSLEPAYGIDKLLRAFALLKGSPPDGRSPKLVVAGEGSLKSSLERLALDLGIAQDTEFVGAIPHQRVPELLNSFSVFVALSTSESFGVAVLEASACGVPVIVSDAGGLPEVVVDGKTGLIIQGGDPDLAFLGLKRIAEDRDLALAMGKEGRRFVRETYDWNENVTRVANAYQMIVKRDRSQ
jgi:glycosyltransferase involved in cell wall biosynthesis